MDKKASARYSELEPRREPFLRRARLYSELTIPTVLPPQGHTQLNELPDTYQSLGSRLVLNLSSRLMTALLPPNVQSFRLTVPAEVIVQMPDKRLNDEQVLTLAIAENIIEGEMGRRRWRAPTYTVLQNLIITGNCAEQMLDDSTLKAYRLDQYVVVRNPAGKVIEFVIKEPLSRASLDENLQALAGQSAEGDATTTPVFLYTWGRWNKSKSEWDIHQEMGDSVVPGSKGSWEVSPFNFLRWSHVIGEDYGRAKVEEHWGDLRYLDGITKDVRDGSKMAARHIGIVKAGGGTGLNLVRQLKNAENGDFVAGDGDQISNYQFENTAGLQISAAERAAISKELGEGFLLNSAYRRDAERVTAFEVSQMAEEIESVLGGVFTQLSQDLSEPRLERLIFNMKRKKQLPEWPEGVIEPQLVTGLEALSRERDVQRAQVLFNSLGALQPHERLRINMAMVLNKFLAGFGWEDAVLTEDEYEAALQREAQFQQQSRVPAQGPAQ